MSRLNNERDDAVELTGEDRWAWGRNGEILHPKYVTVKDMSLPGRPEVWVSVYANDRTLVEGKSPIDLHLSKDDAVRLGARLLEVASGADYTGLHGRNPYDDDDHDRDEGPPTHFVPESWEDLNRGICPQCGRTVSWDDETERWKIDPTLAVFVLGEDEISTADNALDWLATRPDSEQVATAVKVMIERQFELNRPFEEASDG
jgi:hypothetical protein